MKEDYPTTANQESEIDYDLVEQAHSKIKEIFVSHYQAAMRSALLEAGDYIIDTFFNGDLELAHKKTPTKKISYKKLEERLQQEHDGAPKKSWLNNAVNLAIQEKDFSGVQALGQLSSTHKLLLLPVHDRKLKIRLAEESVEKNFSSRALAKRIKEERQAQKTIFELISSPKELFSDDHKELYSHDNLKKLSEKNADLLMKKLENQLKKAQNTIEQQKQFVEKYEELKNELIAKSAGKLILEPDVVKERSKSAKLKNDRKKRKYYAPNKGD